MSRSPLPGTPLVWSPRTVADTLDASTSGAGSMSALSNLISDPSTRDLWQCRPAAQLLADLAGTFNTPTFISGRLVVGNLVYGMVASAHFAGHDEPFCYDITTQAFIPITGTSSGNTPTSTTTTGAWNPPSMALVGADIIVAHPGFTGVGGAYFGVINVANPAAPTWTAQNTTTNALIFPPQWVVNFNGRCFYLVNPPGQQPGCYMSDSLAATSITNANQILTFGDNIPLTCAAGLGLNNQVTGGIVQALMVFKGVTNIYQVTGDYALQNLAVNTLNVSTGTFAPNSVCPSSKGLVFMAPDGIRLIDFNANVGDPIGKDGQGTTVPFFFALNPSRTCAAYNGGVYRIQVQNGNALGNPQQEWWYDFVRDLWSGPHTTGISLIAAYINTFICTIQGAGAKLFQSDQTQSSTSTYTENGTPLAWTWATSFLPDTDQMSECSVIEATLYAQLVAGNNLTVQALNENGAVLDTVTIAATGGTTLWGSFVWGQALWQGASNALFPRQLSWHAPLVFRRMQIQAQGASAAGVKVGRLHMRYDVLGYLQQAS